MLEIAKKYPGPGNTIDWKAAYAENPQWVSRMSYPGKKGQKGFGLASALRKQGFLPQVDEQPIKQRKYGKKHNAPQGTMAERTEDRNGEIEKMLGAGKLEQARTVIHGLLELTVATRTISAFAKLFPFCPVCGKPKHDDSTTEQH